jgi:hypothetical protein
MLGGVEASIGVRVLTLSVGPEVGSVTWHRTAAANQTSACYW